jgi:hypothetical protein
MIRKFRALGLALLAVTAFAALSAQAAQAVPQFTAAKYPATIDATGTGIGEKFVTEAGNVECETSHFTGSLAAASSTLTVTPTYTTCKAFGFVNATVNTEECHYTFHATEQVSSHEHRAHVTVSCPAGQSIKITASTCAAEVKGGQSLTTVDLTSTTTPTPDDVDVRPTVTGIAYTVTNDGFLCPFSGTGAKTGGKYETGPNATDEITVRCTSPANTYVDCSVSGA